MNKFISEAFSPPENQSPSERSLKKENSLLYCCIQSQTSNKSQRNSSGFQLQSIECA